MEYVKEFAFDSTAYNQFRLVEPVASVRSSGFFRSQGYIEIVVKPIEFCPVSRQLSVIDKVEINISFTNPQGEIRQNVGIFNGVASNTFINYEDDGLRAGANDKAFLQKNATPGKVKWINLSAPEQADTIVADYLIICAEPFYNSSDTSQVSRLARHRAYYNGFDVAVLNVENIMSDLLGFEYEGNPNDPDPNNWDIYKKEQRIRTCIRRIYEGQNAQNMGDGYLGYVVLIGDVLENNTLMPTSYDHDFPPFDGHIYRPSDYYFTCITKDSNDQYDNMGDLFIGRISVENHTHLFNMIEKTIYYESEFDPRNWRKAAGFSNRYAGYPSTHELFNSYVRDILDEIGWDYYFVNSWEQPGGLIRDSTIHYFNKGVAFVQYTGVASHSINWADLLHLDFEMRLNNDYQTPFVNTYAPNTGSFTNSYWTTLGCLAEFLTRYSPTKGAVGYIGAFGGWADSFFEIIDTTDLYYKDIYPYFLWKKKLPIAGELLLAAKTQCKSMPRWFTFEGNILEESGPHIFNLFGDPALNILAEGYEITRNATADCQTTLFGTVHIRNGATLTVLCDFYCAENANIVVHPGGKLIVNGGTLTNIPNGDMWQGITVLGDGTSNVATQGLVQIINGGKIENTITGIHAIGGGKIDANEAQFVNNSIAVQIDPVAATLLRTSASFTKTQFLLNDNYLGNFLDFETHLKLSDCKQVTLTACTLSNEATIKSYATGKNTGIWAFNAPLTVRENCPWWSPIHYPSGECMYPERSTFSGFNVAIFATNSGKTPFVSILYSEFSNNLYSVRLNTVDYTRLIKNDFQLTQHNSYGSYVINSTGYAIEENHFRDILPAPGKVTVGLTVSNSGSAENEVYKNTFSNLYVGQQFLCQNAALIGFDGLTFPGLQTLCNTFNNSQYRDILVGDFGFGSISSCRDNTIRSSQGSLQRPAGNSFSQTFATHFESQSSYSITYYYGIGSNENPNISGLITTSSTGRQSSCPSRIGAPHRGEGLEHALAQYNEWNAEYEYWLAKLLAFVGDNEEGYHEVLQMVSYYSALKDNYFNSIIVAVINEKKGEKEEGEGNLYEKLRFLFGYRGHYTDYLSITETFLAENNFDETLATLAKMYKQFEVSKEQIFELKGLESYALWLQQLEKEQKSIYKLFEKELNYLINYVETNTGRGTVFAKNILCELYNICIENGEGAKAESGDDEMIDLCKSVTSVPSVCEKNALENITIHPNPTTGELTISSTGHQISDIEIFDVYGRKISSHHLSSSSHQKIDISHLNSGIYFIKVITKQGNIVKKVVKQ